MSFRLVTFGELSLYRADSPARIALPRKGLGVLALLAANGRPMSRDRVAALLWPEAGGPGATGRGALKQAIYEVRLAIGAADVITGTAEMQLEHAMVSSDVAELETAHAAKDNRRILELYQGTFMDGYHVRDSPELDHWLETHRARYARIFREATVDLAAAAGTRGDHMERVVMLRRLAAHEPLDGRVALALMDALVDAGDRAAALTHFQLHERLLREQLDAAPEATVLSAAERVRRGVSPSGAPDALGASPRTDVTHGASESPVARPRGARVMLAGAVLAIPAIVLVAAMSTSPPVQVVRSLPLPPTAALRLSVLPELDLLYLDGGASFDAELQALHARTDSLIRVGVGSGVVVDPTVHWVWSGDYRGRVVIVRNGRTNAEIGRVKVPGCPHSFALAGEWVWVAQQCDDHISVIDRRARRTIRHIPVPTLSRQEVGGAKGVGDIFVNRATGVAYFSKDNIPHRIDPRTWEVRETPEFDGIVIAINEHTNRIYVRIPNGIRVMDGATERLIAELLLPGTPGSAAVALTGDRVYVTTHSALVVLDGRTDRLLFQAPLGRGFQPDAIAVDAGGRRAWVAGMEAGGSRTLKIVALRD